MCQIRAVSVRSGQQVPSYYDPMREWAILIPRKMDGTGSVTLWMKAASMKHFKLDQFPRPQCHAVSDPAGKCRVRMTLGKIAGANQGSFRLAYEWRPDGKKPRMCRFRLSGGYLIETLHVITEFLKENYEGSFEIRNANGNYLPSTCFRNFV